MLYGIIIQYTRQIKYCTAEKFDRNLMKLALDFI